MGTPLVHYSSSFSCWSYYLYLLVPYLFHFIFSYWLEYRPPNAIIIIILSLLILLFLILLVYFLFNFFWTGFWYNSSSCDFFIQGVSSLYIHFFCLKLTHSIPKNVLAVPPKLPFIGPSVHFFFFYVSWNPNSPIPNQLTPSIIV